MNKLVIGNDIIQKKSLDDSISLEIKEKSSDFGVTRLQIHILKSTSLEVNYQASDVTKLDIWFSLDPHVSFTLKEFRTGEKQKVQYHYELQEKSSMNVQKVYVTEGVREVSYAYLNGEGSTFHSVLKTISKNPEKYDMVVEHNAKNTKSEIFNHGINVENGKLIFNVNGVIPRGMSGSYADQKNRIVTYNEEECKIGPNLLIDEADVVANHSAYIGRFSDEEIFYMMSRGLSLKQSTFLLTKGFLMSKLELSKKQEKELENKLQMIWR